MFRFDAQLAKKLMGIQMTDYFHWSGASKSGEMLHELSAMQHALDFVPALVQCQFSVSRCRSRRSFSCIQIDRESDVKSSVSTQHMLGLEDD